MGLRWNLLLIDVACVWLCAAGRPYLEGAELQASVDAFLAQERGSSGGGGGEGWGAAVREALPFA